MAIVIQAFTFEDFLSGIPGAVRSARTLQPNPLGLSSLGILFPYNKNVDIVKVEINARVIIPGGASSTGVAVEQISATLDLVNFDNTPINSPSPLLVDNDSQFQSPAVESSSRIYVNNYGNAQEFNCFKAGGVFINQVSYIMANVSLQAGAAIQFAVRVHIDV